MHSVVAQVVEAVGSAEQLAQAQPTPLFLETFEIQQQYAAAANATKDGFVQLLGKITYWQWVIIAVVLAGLLLGCCFVCLCCSRLIQKRMEVVRQRKRYAGQKLIKYKSIDLSGFRLEPVAEGSDPEFFEVMDPFEKNFQEIHKKRLKLTGVERVINPGLEKLFLKRKSKMHDPHKRTLFKFHGTRTEESLMSICQTGFRLPDPNKRNMYGQGIYFATDSTKSERYTMGLHKMLLCEVAVGKVLTVKKAMNHLTPELVLPKYDSVFAPRGSDKTGGVMHDEYIIYHPYQAIPRYIISFEVVPLADV